MSVDVGTSSTVAMLRWPDGRVRPLLFGPSPILPSAVAVDGAGRVLVGADAAHAAWRHPKRYEPNPKRRIDDGTVLLGDVAIPVVDLVAALLRAVAAEAARTAGQVPAEVVLTCPASWGPTRRGVLVAAARRAGLAEPRLVAEPVAAAWYFTRVLGAAVPAGTALAVYDFGAGTFDVAVVARDGGSWRVVAADGLDDLGGLDIDAALTEHLRRGDTGPRQPLWDRLQTSMAPADVQARRQLRDHVRAAKETLSRTTAADVFVPLLEADLHLTRDELDTVAAPLVNRTVAVTRAVLERAALPVAGLILVGGASRLPLAATMLLRTLRLPPTALEQPELVVAEGALHTDPNPAPPRPTPPPDRSTSDGALLGPDGVTVMTPTTPPTAAVPPSLAAPSMPAPLPPPVLPPMSARGVPASTLVARLLPHPERVTLRPVCVHLPQGHGLTLLAAVPPAHLHAAAPPELRDRLASTAPGPGALPPALLLVRPDPAGPRLPLFGDPAALLAFAAGAEHDLAWLDGWPELAAALDPETLGDTHRYAYPTDHRLPELITSTMAPPTNWPMDQLAHTTGFLSLAGWQLRLTLPDLPPPLAETITLHHTEPITGYLRRRRLLRQLDWNTGQHWLTAATTTLAHAAQLQP